MPSLQKHTWGLRMRQELTMVKTSDPVQTQKDGFRFHTVGADAKEFLLPARHVWSGPQPDNYPPPEIFKNNIKLQSFWLHACVWWKMSLSIVVWSIIHRFTRPSQSLMPTNSMWYPTYIPKQLLPATHHRLSSPLQRRSIAVKSNLRIRQTDFLFFTLKKYHCLHRVRHQHTVEILWQQNNISIHLTSGVYWTFYLKNLLLRIDLLALERRTQGIFWNIFYFLDEIQSS